MSPILIDTNLAVLFFFGQTNVKYIRKHKRLQKYDEEDFWSLSTYIAASSYWLLCPHVLAETSNLLRYIPDPFRREVTTVFANLVSTAQESSLPSRTGALHTSHLELGLTDAVLLALAETGAVLLTDDLPLYYAAATAGLEAINFAHDQERRFERR